MNKKTIKPALEKISPAFGSTFTIKQYFDRCSEQNFPFWHVHPEMEMVYIKGGNGKRHIGNHISWFRNGDLILIGSNLPHSGFTDRLTGNQSETVIQMKRDFLGESFFHIPEMAAIKQMIERARLGLCFFGEVKRKIGTRIEILPRLNNFDALIELLSILQEMARSNEYKILNVSGVAMEVELQDNNRINVIFNYVQQHFQRPILLEEIAGEVNMTNPAFCRYFKKLTGKTFTKLVNEFRVVHACKLLTEKQSSISDICFESGFNNFSHFNRFFKEITGKNPSAYRKNLKQIVQ